MESNIIINADFRTKESIIAEIKATLITIHETAIWGAVRIGHGLKELKQLVPHGELTDYIQENLGFSTRKFQQYVQFADQYGDENSPYYRAVSNPHTYTDLSFSNALRLLAVPEDQVEDFVIENDITDMTAKELEQTIKDLQKEKERVEELEQKLTKVNSECNAYITRENELVEKINTLQDDIKSAGLCKSDAKADQSKVEIEKSQKDLLKVQKEKKLADERAEKLQKQIDKIKAEQAQVIEDEKMKAANKARKESEDEIMRLTEEKAIAEKGLTFNQELMSFKFIVDNLQTDFLSALNILDEIKKSDPDKAENLKEGLKSVLTEFGKKI